MADKATPRLRLKLILWGAGTLALAICLLVLSIRVSPPASAIARVATTAPADPHRSQAAAAQSLANLLLLFSLLGFAVAAVCAVWLVVDIRNSRPSWKRQK